jgi:hypothetical protein
VRSASSGSRRWRKPQLGGENTLDYLIDSWKLFLNPRELNIFEELIYIMTVLISNNDLQNQARRILHIFTYAIIE